MRTVTLVVRRARAKRPTAVPRAALNLKGVAYAKLLQMAAL